MTWRAPGTCPYEVVAGVSERRQTLVLPAPRLQVPQRHRAGQGRDLANTGEAWSGDVENRLGVGGE